MKVLRISLLLLMAFSLMTGICYGQTAKDYYERGVEYSAAGEFEDAQQEFKKALEIDPFYEPAKGSLELVEDVLEQRIKTESALHLFKATVYDNKGMHDEAIAEYKKAIQIDPSYPEVHNDLGTTYYRKGIYDEAIAAFKKAIEIKPEDAEAHLNLGTIYAGKGMYDKAIAEFKKAIEINPKYAEAHYNLGLAYFDKGIYDEAIVAFKKAIEINPKYAEAHNNLAVAYYQKGEYSLAIKHCDRVIELGYRVHPILLELLKPYQER